MEKVFVGVRVEVCGKWVWVVWVVFGVGCGRENLWWVLLHLSMETDLRSHSQSGGGWDRMGRGIALYGWCSWGSVVWIGSLGSGVG